MERAENGHWKKAISDKEIEDLMKKVKSNFEKILNKKIKKRDGNHTLTLTATSNIDYQLLSTEPEFPRLEERKIYLVFYNHWDRYIKLCSDKIAGRTKKRRESSMGSTSLGKSNSQIFSNVIEIYGTNVREPDDISETLVHEAMHTLGISHPWLPDYSAKDIQQNIWVKKSSKAFKSNPKIWKTHEKFPDHAYRRNPKIPDSRIRRNLMNSGGNTAKELRGRKATELTFDQLFRAYWNIQTGKIDYDLNQMKVSIEKKEED